MERYSDRAIEIIDELHTERLDYESEYLPLIDCANRCKAYEDAEEQGLLVRLPCKKGDKLFILTSDSLTGIEETKCRRIIITNQQGASCAKVIAPCILDDWGDAFRELYLEDFGKTVFLTREEAENAWKGRQNYDKE